MTELTMSLAQVLEARKWAYAKHYANRCQDMERLCATVEELARALAESQHGLQWAAKRLGAVSAITTVLDAPIVRNTALLAQLERKEASHDA